MAKITYGPLITDARGRVGDVLLTRSRGGKVAKALSLKPGYVAPHKLLSPQHADTTPKTPPTRGDLIVAQGSPATWKSLPIGSNGQVPTSNGTDVSWQTPSTGGLTSVGLSMPAQFTVTNSPLTQNGTIGVTWNTQNANAILAGPSSGNPAAPSFRPLAAADIPNLDTSKLTTGTLPAARGGTGSQYVTFNNGAAQVWNYYLPATNCNVLTDAATITIAQGGTGANSQQAAFNNLAPTTTRGDLIVMGAGTNTRLPLGSNGQVLTSNGTDPTWANPSVTPSTCVTALNSETGSVTIKAGTNVTVTASGQNVTISSNPTSSTTFLMPYSNRTRHWALKIPGTLGGTTGLQMLADSESNVGGSGGSTYYGDTVDLFPYWYFNTSGTTNNAVGGYGYAQWQVGRNIYYCFRGGLGAFASDDTTVRLWIGLTNDATGSNMTGNDTPTTLKFAAFRFSTAAGDTHLICCVCDGSAMTTHDSGVAPSFGDGHQHTLEIAFNDTNGVVTFFIDGSQVDGGSGLSTHLPPNGTNLRDIHSVTQLSTTARQIRMYSLYVESDL
jgi:hypothetical protein